MRPHLTPVVGLLIALTVTGLSAQQPACSLLSAGEIQAVIGEKPGDPHESQVVAPGGPAKGQKTNLCMWKVGDQGMVSVGITIAAKGAARDAGLKMLEQMIERLKAQHWTEEKKDFGSAKCSIMTPPPGEKDLPISSGCIAEAKGMGLSVGFMSPTKKLSIEQTKALLDKAIARLR